MSTQPHRDYGDLDTVADRLRRTRERRTSLDQGPFADLIDMSRSTVSNYERGLLPAVGSLMRRRVLKAWAAATDVSVAYLETGIPDDDDPNPDGGGESVPVSGGGQPTEPYVTFLRFAA